MSIPGSITDEVLIISNIQINFIQYNTPTYDTSSLLDVSHGSKYISVFIRMNCLCFDVKLVYF